MNGILQTFVRLAWPIRIQNGGKSQFKRHKPLPLCQNFASNYRFQWLRKNVKLIWYLLLVQKRCCAIHLAAHIRFDIFWMTAPFLKCSTNIKSKSSTWIAILKVEKNQRLFSIFSDWSLNRPCRNFTNVRLGKGLDIHSCCLDNTNTTQDNVDTY